MALLFALMLLIQLPGTYDLKLQIFGHTTNTSTIVIDDKDVSVELTSRRLY